MIYLIAGRPRSGKSYEAVKYHVIPAVQSGRKVITNLPLNIDHFKKIHGNHVEQLIQVVDFDYSDFDSTAVTFPFSKPEHYQDEWRDENGVGPLYVVDEAHFSLPKGGTHPSVKKFYTMHGHYGVDILLMTQHQRQLDVDILNLVEIIYRTVKNTALGSKKTYTKKVQDGNRGAIVNTEQRRYDDSIFPYYKSHTQSKKDVLEREASDIKPIWKHWSIYGSIACFAFVVFMATTQDVNPMKVKESSSEVQSPEPSQPKEPEQVRFVDGKKQLDVQSGNPNEKLGMPNSDDNVTKSRSSSDIDKNDYPAASTFSGGHPFYKVQLHVSGWSSTGTASKPVNKVYFEASRNGQKMFDLELKDLVLAGYQVNVIGECLVYVAFEKYRDYLTCDVPTVGVGGVVETVSASE